MKIFIKKNLAIILSIIFIALAVIIIGFNLKTKEDGTESEYLVSITYSDLEEMADDKDTFILYVGREDCVACQVFVPKFIEVLEENKVTAYYLDTSTLDSDEGVLFNDYINITGTPTVAFIVDGVEEGITNRISNDAASIDYITDKLEVNGYIK